MYKMYITFYIILLQFKDSQGLPKGYSRASAIFEELQGILQWYSAQRLKWFCEAGGSPDEARLEQTPHPFQSH